MPPVQQHTRINLAELKGQIVKKIGAERAGSYFNYLSRLLGQKLSKSEFDKLCFLTLGRENLALHNQLIRSILKNANDGRVPPPPPEKEVAKQVKAGTKRSLPKEDGYHPPAGLPLAPSVWSNGDAFPLSPRKGRSGIRDRRLRDRPSPLGPNGKMDSVSNQLVAGDDGVGKRVVENGDLNVFDMQRPLQHHQVLAEQPENLPDGTLPPPGKRPRIIKRSPHEPVSVHSKGIIEIVNVEDGEESEQAKSMYSSSRSPLQAPLGIPFCPASIGGARRDPPVPSSSSFANAVDIGELFDTETLRKCMEQIAGVHGLNGVSIDCANILNKGLDAYLKQLIKSCVDLARARSGREPVKQLLHKQQPLGKVVNGIWPGHNMHAQSSRGPIEFMQESPKSCHPVSLLDFKVAMELNPQQLGEDWPLLLEKICLRSCE